MFSKLITLLRVVFTPLTFFLVIKADHFLFLWFSGDSAALKPKCKVSGPAAIKQL